jgi:cytochrome b involved in lipid metabolism
MTVLSTNIRWTRDLLTRDKAQRTTTTSTPSMLLGLTILAILITAFIFQISESKWKMFSYFRKSATPAIDKRPTTTTNTSTKEHEASDDIGSNAGAKQKRESATLASSHSANLSPDGTPKALPAASKTLPTVPSFSLNTSGDDSGDDSDHAPAPAFPALNSAQRASAPSPFRKPESLNSISNGAMQPPTALMPPPPRLHNVSRTPQSSAAGLRVPAGAAGLRVPSSGPLPNRGPPVSNSLGVPQSIASKTPNPRQKVLLKPGHSPLDWAHLQKSGANLSGVDRLVRVTPSMLKHNNGRKGRPAWSVYQGKVYNISPYIPFHPGGEGELRRAAGKDGEKLFMEVHPWVNWENMLGECLVGIMVTEHDGMKEKESTLDEMD